jgi:hypothetical protein
MLIKLTRPFEAGSVNGYVRAIGPRFFLLALVDDYIRFNGFECLRTSDVRELEVPHRHAGFAEAALKNRGERIPKKPAVRVASMEALLLSSSRAFPLVTIHREQIDPGVCWVGHVLGVARGCVSFLEISADATWYQRPSEYKLSEITRVDFGGQYEDALHLVGGPAPELTKRVQRTPR